MRGTVIHYSVTAPEQDHARCAGQWEGIRRTHKQTGYRDVAYGFGVCQHGQTFEGRGWGPNAANGNAELNRSYHSICWLGDQHTQPSAAALTEISRLLDEGPNARGEVVGHRDVYPTSCPGDALEAWVQAGATVAPPLPQQEDAVAILAREPGVSAWLIHEGRTVGLNNEQWNAWASRPSVFVFDNLNHDQLLDILKKG